MGCEGVPHFDLRIDLGKPDEGAQAIVRRIRPEWVDKNLAVRRFTGGVTNLLLGCFVDGGDRSDMVLVRLYGENTDLVVERQQELSNIQLLHK